TPQIVKGQQKLRQLLLQHRWKSSLTIAVPVLSFYAAPLISAPVLLPPVVPDRFQEAVFASPFSFEFPLRLLQLSLPLLTLLLVYRLYFPPFQPVLVQA